MLVAFRSCTFKKTITPIPDFLFYVILVCILWKNVCPVKQYRVESCVVLIKNQMEALLIFKDCGRFYWLYLVCRILNQSNTGINIYFLGGNLFRSGNIWPQCVHENGNHSTGLGKLCISIFCQLNGTQEYTWKHRKFTVKTFSCSLCDKRFNFLLSFYNFCLVFWALGIRLPAGIR